MFQEVALLLLSLLFIYLLLSYVTTPKGMPPGPTPLPVIGNLLLVLKWLRHKNMHLEMEKLAKVYNGKLFTLQLPNQNIVVMNSASTAREALLTKRDAFSGRPYFFIFHYVSLGAKNIASADPSAVWNKQRKIVHSAIRLYQPKSEVKLNLEVDQLIKRLVSYQGKPVDPLPEVALLLLNVICAMVFGDRYEIDNPEFQFIFEANKKLLTLVGTFNILNIFPMLIHFPIQESKEIKWIRNEFHPFLRKKYNEHLESYRDGIIRDLTDALIKSLQEEDEEDLKGFGVITEEHVVMTLQDVILAGSETTTTRLLWFILFMARYPEIQAKIQAELDDVVGRQRSPCWEDRKVLHMTMATVEETLRASNASPVLVPHKALEDSNLEGYNIPKGTTVLINAWAMHLDEKEWQEPHVFKPERFLDNEGKLIQVAGIKSFLPFGAGRRVCVGEALAKQVLFTATSRLLHQFKIEPEVPGSPPSRHGVLTNARMIYPEPFKVRFKSRQ